MLFSLPGCGKITVFQFFNVAGANIYDILLLMEIQNEMSIAPPDIHAICFRISSIGSASDGMKS